MKTMKTKFDVFLILSFLFSALVANGNLIPNNKVIMSCCPDDFTLVEGIMYNIVHSRSGLLLDGDDKYAGLSLKTYQKWYFRKAGGRLYNIRHLKSGKNLDSDTKNVYVSSSDHNSMDNPYQWWEFKSLGGGNNNRYYNIEHMMSDYRNLDSDFRDVYISSWQHDSIYNPYQHWEFEPVNYELEALVEDFAYPYDLKLWIDEHKKQVDLFPVDFVRNSANTTIIWTIDQLERRTNSYTLEISESDFFSDKVRTSFHIDGYVFEQLGISKEFVDGIEREFTKPTTYDKRYEEHMSEDIFYHIQENVTVPPYTSMKLQVAVVKLTVDIPFTAKIRITGRADRLDENGNVIPMTYVDIDALRCYIQKENYDPKNVAVEGNSLVIKTSGTLRVDGYGSYSIETESARIAPPFGDGLMSSSYFKLFLFLMPCVSVLGYVIKEFGGRQRGYNEIS